ncbi:MULTISPECIES: hypothetical protein [Niastella]|uniref:Uncharacterized protein n=1 Tax=Niastella soli TaxID=2821487 RepID=A0ABS3YNE1_9BACT|nr:hypothetical protein [Niastella soli]MBO9199400.1 hypothetical protein [Niastella soli]
MQEVEFNENVVHTLRIELLNGKVLKYPIDVENKQYLIDSLRLNADGSYEEDRISFLWFETTYSRQVVINEKSIARVIFCIDPAAGVEHQGSYTDNFGIIDKGTAEGALPSAIVLHKGNAPEDHSQRNPLLYPSLVDGCLASFDLELEGKQRLRQFINLIDEEGEESFIPMEQIMVMEFDQSLFYAEEEGYDEED